jgi:glycerol transport system ATP-binding protein
MLELKNLSASVNGEVYLKNVNLKADPGRIYVLLGRTGSGKTSIMRAVAGLLPLDSGTIHLAGEDLTNTSVWKRDAALVYQQFINYPNKSVRANLEFPLKKLGLKGEELTQRVNEFLDKVGLREFENRKPSQLSGGQQQRVALARSLARKSRILMLDEPLMNLDFKLREQLREEFLELFSGESDSVTLYATTEITEAMMLGYQVLVMHEGEILQTGTPAEVFEKPKNTTVARIVNDPPMSILEAKVSGSEIVLASGLKLKLPAHLSSLGEGTYSFGIRANDLIPSAPGKGTENSTIQFVEVSGSETVLYATSASGEMVIQIEGIYDYVAGSPLSFEIRTGRLFAFDKKGSLLIAPGAGAK